MGTSLDTSTLTSRLARRRRAIVGWALAIAAALFLLHAATSPLRVFGILTDYRPMFRLFDFDHERNLPSLFSAVLFLFNAALFHLTARADVARARRMWAFLAGLFVFLAYDEFFSLHEKLIRPMKQIHDFTGLFQFPWFLVYAPPTALLAAFFLPVWRRLERRVARPLAWAAAVYLAGAVGFEMLGGWQAWAHGRDNLAWVVLCTVEEILEMAGLILLTHALLLNLEEEARRPV